MSGFLCAVPLLELPGASHDKLASVDLFRALCGIPWTVGSVSIMPLIHFLGFDLYGPVFFERVTIKISLVDL